MESKPMNEHETRSTGTFVLIGCGSAKRDPEDDEDLEEAYLTPEEDYVDEPMWQAKDLYTSGYFGLKNEYREYMTEWDTELDGHASAILSAEFGIVYPDTPLPYYDTNAKKLPKQEAPPDAPDLRPDGEPVETKADAWARKVAGELETWTQLGVTDNSGQSMCDRLLILAGETNYTGPLRERGTFDGLSNLDHTGPGLAVEPEFPFNEIDASGIGDQMGWLGDVNEKLSETT